MAINTYTNSGNQLTAENAEFYNRTMLERFIPEIVFSKYAKKMPIPANNGGVISARRLELPTISTTALTEGVTPAEMALTVTKVTGTVAQYGNFTKISDQLDLLGLDPIITESAGMLGEYGGRQADMVVRDALLGTTNAMFANSRVSRATLAAGDKISAADIMKARTILVKNNAKMISLPNGGMGYVAFVHPDTAVQIFALQEWKDQNTYVDVENRKMGIIGQIYGVYFIETPNAPVFTNGGSGGNLAGKSIIVIGRDAYAVADVSGGSKPEIIVKEKGGTDNPLDLFSTVGYKTLFAVLRLNDSLIVKYDCLDA